MRKDPTIIVIYNCFPIIVYNFLLGSQADHNLEYKAAKGG